MEAYSKLDSQYREKYNLVLVGHGECLHTLKKLSYDLNISHNLIFITDEQDPFSLIKDAQIFCLSSKNEGFPNVLVESMICKTAVISSDCNYGPRDILDDGNCGLLYPVGDVEKLTQCIDMLLKDELMRNQFVEKAYKKAQQYDVEIIAKMYWEQVFND